MPDYTPISSPDFTGKTKPQGTDLTESQQEKYHAVLEHFDSKEYKLPGVPEDEAGLKEVEKYWLTFECMLRYLRAVKWASADAAIKRLEGTLKWRREFGWYDKITPEHVEPEALTGKADIFGFDAEGRPGFYMTPSKQNTEESPRQIEFTFFMMERLIDLTGPGVETLALMINFGDRGKNPSIQTARTVVDILQTHYPERLGRAYVINIPFVINMFLKVMLAVVDPITRAKVALNPKVVEEGHFDSDQVKQQFGGAREFEYVHEKYWPEFLRMCEEKRNAEMKRWREMGGKVGLKEWDIKGGGSAVKQGDAEKTMALADAAVPQASPSTPGEKATATVEEIPVEEPSVSVVAA